MTKLYDDDLYLKAEQAMHMLSAVAGDIEDGGSLESLRGKYINALVNLRDDIRSALARARGDQ